MKTYERFAEVEGLRGKLLFAALEHVTEMFRLRGTAALATTTNVDDAAKALADKLREPETCFTCGQEVKP